MMTNGIFLEELTTEHLREWYGADVTTGDGYCDEVFTANRLLPFVSADSEGTLMVRGMIYVPDVTPQVAVAMAQARVAELKAERRAG